MLKTRFLLVSLLLFATIAEGAKAKYIFLFIGDGMSTPQRMVADEFARKSGRGSLALNNLAFVSQTRTRSANSLVTDSAAAATAIGCGEKAVNGALGLTPDGKRIESVAELAKKQGRKVGILTTVTINHATPAGFYAHRRSRGDAYRIGLDLVASDFDYFAGGGFAGSADNKDVADYKGNIFDLAVKAGYKILRTKEELNRLTPGDGKVWGVFSNHRLDFAIDWSGKQPTLAEMVAKGIQFLDNPKGFFMMAEGGTVDYGAHGNDAATVLHDILALDDAVKVALDWEKSHPAETLIITTGDHETGGMSMGFAGTGYNFYIELLAYQKTSFEAYSYEIGQRIKENGDLTFDDIKPSLTEKFGFLFTESDNAGKGDRRMLLKATEIGELKRAFEKDVDFIRNGKKETTAHDTRRLRKFSATAIRIMSNHAGIGWTSGAHTALPTMTTADGVFAERFTGFLENYDIARKLKDILAE